MKQLLIGVVLLLLIGIGGFVYRNALEHPMSPVATNTAPTACTMEAKLCPNGASVGRTGANCAFAACPLPNIELPQIHIAFVLPTGYVANPAALGKDTTLIGVYEKSATGDTKHSILVRDYPIPSGQTANRIILANTVYESSGNTAQSMSEFTPVVIGGKTFYSVVLERFEGQVHSAYYLPRATDVLRFEVLEKDVTNWTDSKLVVADLPEHHALLDMLATLEDD